MNKTALINWIVVGVGVFPQTTNLIVTVASVRGFVETIPWMLLNMVGFLLWAGVGHYIVQKKN